MSSNEVDFLRDQVERLNALLGKYQEQYSLPLQEEVDRAHRPWLTNKELVSPLMQEYDVILQQLEKEAADYKGQVLNFRQQLGELVTENDRLRIDLKEVVNQQLDGSGGGSVHTLSAGQSAATATPSVANVQHQLRLALQEKAASQERWRETSQELDRVEAEMQSMKDSHQWRTVEKKAHDIQDQYSQSVSVLNTELETLQSDLRQVKQELGESQRQTLELKKANYTLQQQLARKDDERAEGIFKEGITDSKMAEVQRITEDLRQRVVNANRETDDLKREKSVMDSRITEMSRRLAETEGRENEAIQQVREAITMAETSVLEKDQAELQSRHKEEEVSQLQESLSKIIDEAGWRTRQEVDNVRKQLNERVTKLTEELHALEMDNTEKQAQVDRLLREKRAVESELAKIQREGRLEVGRTKGTVQELSHRVSEAERGKDELGMRVETLTQALDKERDEKQQLKDSLQAAVQMLTERLAALQQEFEVANDDRQRDADAINMLSKKLQAAEGERDAVHRKFLKELALIEQDTQTKTRGFEVQIQTTEDSRRTSSTELKKLLGGQQRMSAKWKEECQTITHKFEIKVEELRSEVTQLKRRNEQLTSMLKESQVKTAEAERVMSEYTRNIRRMESRMIKAESHSAEVAKQASRSHLKERQLESERQSLINELSRSQREKYFQPHPDINENNIRVPLNHNPRVRGQSVKAQGVRGHGVKGHGVAACGKKRAGADRRHRHCGHVSPTGQAPLDRTLLTGPMNPVEKMGFTGQAPLDRTLLTGPMNPVEKEGFTSQAPLDRTLLTGPMNPAEKEGFTGQAPLDRTQLTSLGDPVEKEGLTGKWIKENNRFTTLSPKSPREQHDCLSLGDGARRAGGGGEQHRLSLVDKTLRGGVVGGQHRVSLVDKTLRGGAERENNNGFPLDNRAPIGSAERENNKLLPLDNRALRRGAERENHNWFPSDDRALRGGAERESNNCFPSGDRALRGGATRHPGGRMREDFEFSMSPEWRKCHEERVATLGREFFPCLESFPLDDYVTSMTPGDELELLSIIGRQGQA